MENIEENEEKPSNYTVPKFVAGLFLAVSLLYFATLINIYSYSTKRSSCQAETAVVLGAAVWTNRPSPVFAERINYAIDLYRERKIKKMIFTGGKSDEDNISEAEAAKAYAIERGVAAEDIYLENRSWTTYTNLVNAKEIINQNNLGQVMIISDPLHLKRAAMMSKGLGISACTSGTPTTRYRSFWPKFTFLLRESYFYLQYFIIKM